MYYDFSSFYIDSSKQQKKKEKKEKERNKEKKKAVLQSTETSGIKCQ